MCGNGSTTGRGNYLSAAQTDPEGPATGSDRVRRDTWLLGEPQSTPGRACVQLKHLFLVPSRFYVTPSNRFNIMGLRVAFKAIQPDLANPELELLGGTAITLEAGQAWSEPGVEAHDVRDGNITSSVSVTGTVDVNATGTYLLNYTVADAAWKYCYCQPQRHGCGHHRSVAYPAGRCQYDSCQELPLGGSRSNGKR